MNVLIVHAHPEPQSFNGALTRRAVEVLTGAGHAVIVSDLYAQNFDPVSDRRNFTTVFDPGYLRLQAEERLASEAGGYFADLQAEMDRLAACDLLIFQFPMWWLGLPAILKGWVDRVFAVGRAYGGGRQFDRGMLSDKRAMCSVTSGGPLGSFSKGGVYADIEEVLFPVHRGIFGFVGMTVLEPFVVYGPGRMTDEARRTALDRYERRLLTLDEARVLPMPVMAHHEGGEPKAGA